ETAKKSDVPMVVTGNGELSALAALAEKVKSKGFDNIVLNPASTNSAEILKNYTLIRRSALEKNIKPFGYPAILHLQGDNIFINSIVGICKYASIIVFDDLKDCEHLSLLTLRQNIFTDPQKPLQVDAGIHKIGEPDERSPVFVTTNFSLTYFIVSTEIEGSGYSGHLILADAEGQSVLTAWAAGKFSGEIVGKFVKSTGIEDKVNHRDIIIPGYAAVISGELEDNLPGWNVKVGPQEASDIPSYLKEVWSGK
ncbi:acetyl-CoA decarbonylase/synthase complex subunit gamma, partial [candidate division KSB1 bacterium]